VVHLLAMAGWLGGLAVLVTLLVRTDELPTRTEVERFSKLAFGCVVVLVATGTYAAWRQVGTFGALIDTKFGLLLVLKFDLVLLMVGCAWVARRWLRRKAGPWATLRKAVAVEAALAVVVLGVTTVLVDTEPARTAHARAAVEGSGPVNRTVDFNAGGPGGAGKLDLTVDPAGAGVNQLHLYVSDQLGQLKDVPEVTASFSFPEKQIDGVPVKLWKAGAGHWQGAGINLPLPGDWQLKVTVRTSEIDQATVAVPVAVR
jgi:copper transport protein